MVRAYERLAETVAAAQAKAPGLEQLHVRLEDHRVTAERSTYLGHEAWRIEREAAYAEMFEACSAGLGQPGLALPLLLAGTRDCADRSLVSGLAAAISRTHPSAAQDIAAVIADFALHTQALLRIATRCQSGVNARLGRAAPERPFSARDIAVHVRLQGPQQGKRLPFLFDELEDLFGIVLDVDAGAITLSDTAGARLR